MSSVKACDSLALWTINLMFSEVAVGLSLHLVQHQTTSDSCQLGNNDYRCTFLPKKERSAKILCIKDKGVKNLQAYSQKCEK